MSVMSALTPVGRDLLRDQALRRIRAAIVHGDLEPGAVIKDAQLAELLGLSVAPIRVALARLAEEGLVEAKPQSHTRVTPLDVGQVRDAAVVVRALHELAVREVAGRLTTADVAAMRAANVRFAAAVAAQNTDAALAAAIDRLTPAIRRLERQRFDAAGGQVSVELHDRLIEALESGDADVALATTTTIWTALLSELTQEPE